MLGGDVFFLLGAILVLAIFDPKIAIAAILMTTFGDLAAALVGKKFGKHKFVKNKSWEGTIAELIVNIAIGMIIFMYFDCHCNFYKASIWAIILVMSLTATIVETFVSKLDDNLLIPVFAGFNGQIVALLLDYLN
jgi:dolichol kinase